jgi:hypothetical protein
VHLIRCQRRLGIAASFPGAKPALTCVFCPESDPRMAGRSYARVVTRKSDDVAAHSSGRRKWPLSWGFSFVGQDDR